MCPFCFLPWGNESGFPDFFKKIKKRLDFLFLAWYCNSYHKAIIINWRAQKMEFTPIKLRRGADEPLHLQLAEELRRYLLDNSVKCDFLPSERSLCEQLKLNRSTVHRAYENLLQRGVVRQCPNKKLKVIPGAKKILAGAFPSIGVLLPEKFSLYVEHNNGSTLRYLKGIFDRAAERECSIYTLQIPPPETPEKEMRTFIESNFQKLIGIIHLGARKSLSDPALEMVFKYHHLPQICISGRAPTSHTGAIYTDFTAAARELARTLVAKKCRTVGVISNTFSESGAFSYVAQERGARVRDILVAEGLTLLPRWELNFPLKSDIPQLLAENYARHPELPDFIWCHNDDIALLALQFFTSQGIRVPEDLKIAGFDGSDPAKDLTSIGQQFHELGAGAVDLLWEHFEHGINKENKIKTIEAFFVPGKTV